MNARFFFGFSFSKVMFPIGLGKMKNKTKIRYVSTYTEKIWVNSMSDAGVTSVNTMDVIFVYFTGDDPTFVNIQAYGEKCPRQTVEIIFFFLIQPYEFGIGFRFLPPTFAYFIRVNCYARTEGVSTSRPRSRDRRQHGNRQIVGISKNNGVSIL